MRFIPVINSEPGFMNFSALLNSRCPYRPHPAVLGIALALAVLSVSALASIQVKAPDCKRVEAAVAEVRGSAGVELVTRNAIPNERGDTIVHANQTVQGHGAGARKPSSVRAARARA